MAKKNSLSNQIEDFLPIDEYEDDFNEEEIFSAITQSSYEYTKIALELTKLIIEKGAGPAKTANEILEIYKKSVCIVNENSFLKEFLEKNKPLNA